MLSKINNFYLCKITMGVVCIQNKKLLFCNVGVEILKYHFGKCGVNTLPNVYVCLFPHTLYVLKMYFSFPIIKISELLSNEYWSSEFF